MAQTTAARFVGQRLPRKEDKRLLTGRGSYVADVSLPGMVELAFVRSQVARGKLRGIDIEAARAYPGVRAVLSAKDLDSLGAKCQILHGGMAPAPHVDLLARDNVRYVGEPIVMVIADSRYIAEDAAGLVFVDCTMEDPVITIDDARDGPPVHPDFPTNVADRNAPPENPALEAAFASAAHVVEATIRHQRQAHVPMETRGVVAARQGVDELLVHLACQSPHLSAHLLANTFNLPQANIRVIAKDVGGAFGLKVQPWREELCAVAAALLLNRPVKWIEDRMENLTSAGQAREQEIHCRLALDANARLLAADYDYACNIGAFPQGVDTNFLVEMFLPGPYHLPLYRCRNVNYYSNTVGQAAYRGPWAMESLARETMMELAARQIGITPEELRRRNLITAADQPFSMVTGAVIDRVTPRECFEAILEKVDMATFRAEQAEARKAGRYLGIGFSVYIEPTTMGFGVLSSEFAHIRVDPTGAIIANMGTHSQGHGTATTMAQVIADELGVEYDRVTVHEDDSSRGAFGAGAGGSRQAVAGGGAAIKASALLAAKIKTIAGHMLNANPEMISMQGGRITVEGEPEVSTTLERIAATAYADPDRLPPGMEPGLEAQYRFRSPMFVFSNAAHACICEVDGETGITRVLRWIAAEDCGVMINPSIVEGQIAGGVVQAIGGVLSEEISYDAMGNPTAVTFKDYVIPSAHDVPQIEYIHLVTPSTSDGGFKGVGEGGAIVGPPAMVNAVADALAPFGGRCYDLPLTPSRLLAIIDGGEG